ncbi:MAG: hypothetical protein LBD67_02995 [Candidatus Accumulibacter sp.]|jgi:hypothetical protein|nr:hypothetical protein [Accumulibacter sp.]
MNGRFGLSSPYPSTSSGRTDWKGDIRKCREIKNSLRTLFFILFCFFAIRGKRVKNPSTPSLLNHRQRLFPFVLSLSKQERTLQPFQS